MARTRPRSATRRPPPWPQGEGGAAAAGSAGRRGAAGALRSWAGGRGASPGGVAGQGGGTCCQMSLSLSWPGPLPPPEPHSSRPGLPEVTRLSKPSPEVFARCLPIQKVVLRHASSAEVASASAAPRDASAIDSSANPPRPPPLRAPRGAGGTGDRGGRSHHHFRRGGMCDEIQAIHFRFRGAASPIVCAGRQEGRERPRPLVGHAPPQATPPPSLPSGAAPR